MRDPVKPVVKHTAGRDIEQDDDGYGGIIEMTIFPNEENYKLGAIEINRLKAYYAKRWQDPVLRVEDIFNVRRADGSLVSLKIPAPQQKMLQDGILGKSRHLVGTGVSYVSVTNKGRQIGASVVLGAEQILIAEDFSNTFIYYVATSSDQAVDWMMKVNQLIEDSNHWPPQLGGGPILNVQEIKKVYEKRVNDTLIIGLSANPSAIRGKTGISVVFDEAAWSIRFKHQAKETWKALRYIIRQGGSARIQSTPRTSDPEEFFWGMYKKGEEGNMAIHTYDMPVITNWREIDLESPLYIELDNRRRELFGMTQFTEHDINEQVKMYAGAPSFEYEPGKYLRQKCIVPYWWISIQDLETDRASDLEQFKQENLGIPLDETYKLLKTAWIFGNPNEGDETEDRGDSKNTFYITIDFAQKHDLTAITVTEKMGDIFVERRIEESQDSYTRQRDIIFALYQRFTPERIIMDYTGHGIPIYDMLVEKLRDNSVHPRILMKVTFTAPMKEQLAQGFRNIVMPDPLTGKSRYRWLCNPSVKKFKEAVRHCTRVEKVYHSTGVSYSGKMHGRDDHFWSKSMIALVDQGSGNLHASFGKTRIPTVIGNVLDRAGSMGKRFLAEINKKRMSTSVEADMDKAEFNKSMVERAKHNRNVVFALKCLSNGVCVCKTRKKPVKPIHCAFPGNCNQPRCPGFRYVMEVCERYGVKKGELWKKQRIYKT